MPKKKKQFNPHSLILALLISIISFFIGFQVKENTPPNPTNQQINRQTLKTGLDIVEKVLDGDTFVLPGKQRVRLMKVEAPDLENCGGPEAKAKLEELILGKEVTLKGTIVDRYGRMVAFVYTDNILVNELMLKQGFASYLGASSNQPTGLNEAVNFARKNRIGIYSEKSSPINPPSPECLIKGNVARDTGKKIYHFSGCSGYNNIKVERYLGDDWFCSEEEAQKAGFRKSQNCFGKKYVPST